MKKTGIIAAIIVVIVGGVLLGINYYEGRVTRSIQETMAQLPPSWKGEIHSVDYSLFGNNLVLGGFSLTINSSEGPYTIKADEVKIDGLDASVFRSGVPGRLANSIVLKDCGLSMPNGVEQFTEFMELKEVSGDFGHLADLIQNNAPAEIILPVVYRIRASHLAARNYTRKDAGVRFNTCVFADVQGRAITVLTARELIFKDIKMYHDERLACTFEDMTAAMDLSALADSYLPGRELGLFRKLFNPGVQASFSLVANKMKIEASDDSPGGEMESISLSYANTANELTLQGKMLNLIIPLPEDQRKINASIGMDCKVTDDAFNPLKLDMELKDMGKFSMVAELQGRAPASSKIGRVEVTYKDEGLVDVVVENTARQQGISVSAARQQLQYEIRNSLTERGNPLLADLGYNLEKMVGNPGILTLTIAPEEPLSSQQFSMYMLLQPMALNYSFQITAP